MNMLKKWFPSKYLAATNIEEDEIVTVRKIVDDHVGRARRDQTRLVRSGT